MIVRLSDKMANLILGIEGDSTIVDDSRPAVWDGERLVRAPAARPSDISHLLPYVPGWLSEMAADGTTMFVDPAEFASLDYELRQQFDVIKY